MLIMRSHIHVSEGTQSRFSMTFWTRVGPDRSRNIQHQARRSMKTNSVGPSNDPIAVTLERQRTPST